MLPIATSGSSDAVELDRMPVRTSRATTVAPRPANIRSERPFTPRRSLSQPVTNTDTAPTPGKTALMRAALLTL